MVIGDTQVDHAVRVLHIDRADFARLVDAKTAALDHRGAAHAYAGVLGGDYYVATTEQRSVPREAVTRGDPHERHQTR